MLNVFQADKAYDSTEVLKLLAADVDSDKEDFDESNHIIIEQENSSQDDEDECAEDESLENKNFHPSNSNSENILNRDGTVWENQTLNSDERTSGSNIIQTRPRAKQFILARVDTALDVFKKLWSHQNVEWVLRYTKAEVFGREITNFLSLSKN